MASREEEMKKYREKRASKTKNKKPEPAMEQAPPVQLSGQRKQAGLLSLLWRYAASKRWWAILIFSILLAGGVGNWMEEKEYQAPDIFVIPAYVFGGVHVLYFIACIIIIQIRGAHQIEMDIKAFDEDDDDSDRPSREDEIMDRISRDQEYNRTHDQDFGHTH